MSVPASHSAHGYLATMIFCLILRTTPILAASGAFLYVSPDGSDANAGTKSKPLATLAGARDAIRLKSQAWKSEGVSVVFMPGTYFFDQVVHFEEKDSGRPDAAIVYKAEHEAKVRFCGGAIVDSFVNAAESKGSDRLPPEVQEKILFADLNQENITDLGKLSTRGFGMGSPPAEAELFYDGKPMTLARWPNTGFRGLMKSESPEDLVLDTDRTLRWASEQDPWIFAYWHHDWAELHEPIVKIGADPGAIRRSSDIKPQYGITPGRARWYAYNLLSELDAPEEYYIDRENGRLFFWPPEPGGEAIISTLDTFVDCQDASNITFEKIRFEACRANAIQVTGGRNVFIIGCTILNTGHKAVQISGGSDHQVFGCAISYCGEGGISMSGGDRPSLTPGNHLAENNHVHHYSRRARTYKPGISISGVGNKIAHNLIHHGPHMALSAGGNDHVIEYNEIHNVVYESGDAGAYYVGRDWTQRGNILRYNYWHHIVGGTGYGGMTIYLDDQHSGHTIYGNIFERCAQAVFIGGGDDNIVTNNVFIDCWRAAHIDNRGMGWQKAATDDPNGTLLTRFRSMPVDSDLWVRKYPTLHGTLEDEPNIPKRNHFERNVSAGGTWDDINQETRHYQVIKDNIVFDDDSNWIKLVKDDEGRLLELKFKDPAALASIGFEPIPLDKIGLYKDPRRAEKDIRRNIEPITLPED